MVVEIAWNGGVVEANALVPTGSRYYLPKTGITEEASWAPSR
jgi:hypothetical protein